MTNEITQENTTDFYCDFVLNGKIEVKKVMETANVLAYYHTRPFWPVHIVVVPKQHISSLLAPEVEDPTIVMEMLSVIRQVAAQVTAEHGACCILTNLGEYQDSKHLHWHVTFGQPLR